MQDRRLPLWEMSMAMQEAVQTYPMLRLYLFGAPYTTWQDRPLDLPRRQTRALLYRLGMHLEPVPRDHLCLLLWPELPDSKARQNLARVLYLLRRELPDPNLLWMEQESVRLNPELVWSDVHRFVEECRDDGDLEAAVGRLRGPLLDGFSLPESEEFERWLDQERRHCEQLYRQALLRLIDQKTASGDRRSAIEYAHRYLSVDELDEGIHRRLIHLYAADGDRTAAIRQYQSCTAILARELGVDPLPETRAAYQMAIADPGIFPRQPAASPGWTTLPGLDLPLIGRSELLAEMGKSVRQAQEGNGHLLLLSGEAGIGKSRLLQEFVARLQGDALVLIGHAQPGEQALPYQPLVQGLRQGLQEMGIMPRLESVWLAELSLLLPEVRTLYPDLPAPLASDPNGAQARLYEALLRLILAMIPADRPLVLCVDDLHWCDSATLDWLAFLGRRLRGQRLLVVCSYRSEEAGSVAELRRQLQRLRLLVEHPLAELDLAAVGELVRHFDPALAAAETLVSRLHQATGGHTFFLLETLRTLREKGYPVQDGDGGELPVADTVQETVRRRLNRLSPVARQVIEVAAILGLSFPFDEVQQASGRNLPETLDALQELAGRFLLREGAEGYHFHHDIIRVVVLASLPAWRAGLLQRRAAETLETLHSKNLDPVSRQIAGHYEAAAHLEQAIVYYSQAAEVALRIFAYQEAATLLTHIIDLLHSLPETPERDRQELEILFRLGPVLLAHRGFSGPGVHETYERAWALAQQAGEQARLFPTLWGIWSYYNTGGQLPRAFEVGRQLLDLAAAEENLDYLLEAHRALGSTSFHAGNLILCRHHYEEVIALYDPRLHHTHATQYGMDPATPARAMSSMVIWFLGYPDQALEQAMRAVEDADASNHLFGRAYAALFAAWVCQLRRESAAAQVYAEEAIALSRQNFFNQLLAMATVLNGWAWTGQDRIQEGIAQMESGLEGWHATGSGICFPAWLSVLAEAYGKIGDFERAHLLLAEAMAEMEQRGERRDEAELYRLQGDLLWQESADLVAIEASYQQALLLARRQQAKSLELRAAIGLARLWRTQGKADQARPLLEEIYAWFTEGFDTADLREARELLGE
jgi:DNA-binding SARP family transcriptional activator/predicted ATPase